MKLWLGLLFFVFPLLSRADDLNGVWKGTLTQGAGGCYPRYSLELQISFLNNNITGRAYDYFDSAKYVKMNFTGKYNPQTHRLVLIETKIIQSNIPPDCAPCIKTYDLTYSKDGGVETLTGDWKGHILGRANTCPPGKIMLRKTDHSDFRIDIEQNDTLAELQKSIHLQPRSTQLLKTLIVDSPKIKIELYDDAVVDNDTISVFINNKLILYRQMLSEKPLTVYFNAFPQTEYELVMYADNLGTIPPNTALMVVTAGSKRFEVFLSSSEEKSAAVKFLYKGPGQ